MKCPVYVEQISHQEIAMSYFDLVSQIYYPSYTKDAFLVMSVMKTTPHESLFNIIGILRTRQNNHHFTEQTFECIYLNKINIRALKILLYIVEWN